MHPSHCIIRQISYNVSIDHSPPCRNQLNTDENIVMNRANEEPDRQTAEKSTKHQADLLS